MPTDNPTPPPRGTGKFVVIAGAIVGVMIVIIFVGMNLQHTQTMKDEKAGVVKPQDVPMHEKDLGKSPTPAK